MTTLIINYNIRSCTYFGVNCQYAIFFIAINPNVGSPVTSNSNLLAGAGAV
jgi:hypothetical protein